MVVVWTIWTILKENEQPTEQQQQQQQKQLHIYTIKLIVIFRIEWRNASVWFDGSDADEIKRKKKKAR